MQLTSRKVRLAFQRSLLLPPVRPRDNGHAAFLSVVRCGQSFAGPATHCSEKMWMSHKELLNFEQCSLSENSTFGPASRMLVCFRCKNSVPLGAYDLGLEDERLREPRGLVGLEF